MNAFLATTLVKATLLLLVTAAVLRLSPRASAASRHIVALVGLLGALAVPVFGFVLPRWEVPFVPARLAFSQGAPAPAAVALPTLAPVTFTPDNRGTSPAGTADALAGSAGPVGVQVPPSVAPAPAPSRVPKPFGVDAAKVATTLWILGALVPLAALAIGFRRAGALVKNARPADDAALLALAGEISERLALSRPVPVLLSAEITVPMTAGLLNPVLLLPEAARAWPRERQRVVLLHELAHVARRDLGAFLVSEFATASYWFHPLAHFVAAQLRRSAEEASDDLVLGDGTRASDYASHLVGIVRGLRAPAAPEAMPVLAMARPSDLEERVRAILDPRRSRRAPSRVLTASLSAAGIAGALVLAAAVPGVARPALAMSAPESERVFAKAGSPDVVFAKNPKKRGDTGASEYERGKEAHEDGDYLEAAEAYKKAVELGYREDTAAYNAACAYARAGKKDDAFVWLNKSVELGFDIDHYLRNDDDLDSLRKDPRFTELKKAARSAKADGGDAARALRHFERLTRDGSKKGAGWYEAGKELLDADQLDKSEKAFRTAASLGYRDAASTYNAACALARAHKKAEALDALQKSIELGYTDARHMERDDDLDELHGEKRFLELVDLAEDFSLDMGFGGVMGNFLPRSRWRSEVTRYEKVAKAHPTAGIAWSNLGHAQLMAERPEAAAASFGKALDLGYRKATTLYNLACAEARSGNTDKAFDRLNQSIDAGFDSADHIRHDDDLDALHGDPRFKKALERAKARKTDD